MANTVRPPLPEVSGFVERPPICQSWSVAQPKSEGLSMLVGIREATVEDAEAIAKVHVNSWQAAYQGILPDGYLAKLTVEPRRSEKLLQILLRDKALHRVTPELIFHRDALAELRAKLSSYKKAKGERISVPVFKDLTGITRKYAIPLLEYLDRERVTRRLGDERVIL